MVCVCVRTFVFFSSFVSVNSFLFDFSFSHSHKYQYTNDWNLDFFSLVWLFIRISFDSLLDMCMVIVSDYGKKRFFFCGRHFFFFVFFSILKKFLFFSIWFLFRFGSFFFWLIYVNINSTFIISRFNIANFSVWILICIWDCVGHLTLLLRFRFVVSIMRDEEEKIFTVLLLLVVVLLLFMVIVVLPPMSLSPSVCVCCCMSNFLFKNAFYRRLWFVSFSLYVSSSSFVHSFFLFILFDCLFFSAVILIILNFTSDSRIMNIV